MLDIKTIKSHFQELKQAIQDKSIDLDLDELLNLSEKRADLIRKVENYRSQKNKANKEIISLDSEAKKAKIQEMRLLDEECTALEKALKKVEQNYQELMWRVPLIPEKDSIRGGEEKNEVIETLGVIPEFDFKIKDHIQLGKLCDLIDFERGVKVTGNRGFFLKNELVRLEFSLMKYALDFLVKRGFTPLGVPLMAGARFFYGTGHFPFAQEETFVAKDKEKDSYLIGTSEIPLCAYYADEILDEKDLPYRLTAYSPCFRTEVGSYGKDTRGLYRVRQFYKVEQFIICRKNLKENDELFTEILENTKEFMRSLNLPIHVVKVATGDMGAGKYRMCDIEGWMPSRASYGELGSCSSLLDWQARRSNIKYKTQERKKEYVYTLNNTLVASPRIFISLLELNQKKDGSIEIPEILRPYCGFSVIKPKNKA